MTMSCCFYSCVCLDTNINASSDACALLASMQPHLPLNFNTLTLIIIQKHFIRRGPTHRIKIRHSLFFSYNSSICKHLLILLFVQNYIPDTAIIKKSLFPIKIQQIIYNHIILVLCISPNNSSCIR